MNLLIKKFPRGIPALGMKPIDVVDIKNSKFWNDEKVGAFWLDFDLFNQVNYGFENTTITKVSGFDENPTSSLLQRLELENSNTTKSANSCCSLRWRNSTDYKTINASVTK